MHSYTYQRLIFKHIRKVLSAYVNGALPHLETTASPLNLTSC